MTACLFPQCFRLLFRVHFVAGQCWCERGIKDLKALASFNMKKACNMLCRRHVICFVEKAGFEPRTLGTKRSAMITALHAR